MNKYQIYGIQAICIKQNLQEDDLFGECEDRIIHTYCALDEEQTLKNALENAFILAVIKHVRFNHNYGRLNHILDREYETQEFRAAYMEYIMK